MLWVLAESDSKWRSKIDDETGMKASRLLYVSIVSKEINREASKIEKNNKVKQISAAVNIIMLIYNKKTSGRVNYISFQFTVMMTVRGRQP